jgi:hypothetical protein
MISAYRRGHASVDLATRLGPITECGHHREVYATTANKTIMPLRMRPAMAHHFFLSRTTPIRLKIKPKNKETKKGIPM